MIGTSTPRRAGSGSQENRRRLHAGAPDQRRDSGCASVSLRGCAFELPTPCDPFNVTELITKATGHLDFLRAGLEKDRLELIESDRQNDSALAATGATPRRPSDYRVVAAEDYLDSFNVAIAALLDELRADVPATSPVGLSGAHTFTRFQMLVLCTRNTFQYSWDLAKATGQSTDLDRQLATELLEYSRTIVVPQRGEGGFFGPEFVPPAGSPVVDVLAGFLGREF